jgi:uncharacterized protein (DUF952 family)
MSVYKILRAGEWQALQDAGRSDGSPDDRRDGYVHLSTAPQVQGTLGRHFAGDDGLWILEIEEAALGTDLRWEPARGGEPFPHLYRALELRDVERAEPVRRGEPLPFGLT